MPKDYPPEVEDDGPSIPDKRLGLPGPAEPMPDDDAEREYDGPGVNDYDDEED